MHIFSPSYPAHAATMRASKRADATDVQRVYAYGYRQARASGAPVPAAIRNALSLSHDGADYAREIAELRVLAARITVTSI